jgi:hypothetical protein
MIDAQLVKLIRVTQQYRIMVLPKYAQGPLIEPIRPALAHIEATAHHQVHHRRQHSRCGEHALVPTELPLLLALELRR